MVVCKNCGKLIIKGVVKCGWCETPLSDMGITNVIPIQNDDVYVSVIIKRIVAVIQLLIGWQTLYIGSLLCYYVFAPWGAGMGKKHNRDPDYGFFYGGVFSLLGLFIYWIYLIVTKDPITIVE